MRRGSPAIGCLDLLTQGLSSTVEFFQLAQLEFNQLLQASSWFYSVLDGNACRPDWPVISQAYPRVLAVETLVGGLMLWLPISPVSGDGLAQL